MKTFFRVDRKIRKMGYIFGFLLLLALVAFEVFNYDTTNYAFQDMMGNANIYGWPLAGIFAIAFCAIDFAGLGRLFTSDEGKDDPAEVWYLLGTWVLVATFNASF